MLFDGGSGKNKKEMSWLMKKILAIFLAINLIFALSAPVLAATDIGSSGEASADTEVEGDYSLGVNASYTPGVEGALSVLSVDIAWGGMNFEYKAASMGTWDPDTHDYIDPVAGGWTDAKATITVTNHSNVAIRAGFKFVSAVAGLSATFTSSTFVVPSADSDQYRTLDTKTGELKAPSGSTQLGIDSSSTPIVGNVSTLGVISVNIWEGDALRVGNVDELRSALASGGNIKLTASIDASRYVLDVTNMNYVTLDLCGYTLTALFKPGMTGYPVTIQNGTLRAPDDTSYVIDNTRALVRVKNCTVISESPYSIANDAELYVENCTLSGGIYCTNYYTDDDSVASVSGSTFLTGSKFYAFCERTTLTLEIDPGTMLGYGNAGTVINNGNGTWTLRVQ